MATGDGGTEPTGAMGIAALTWGAPWEGGDGTVRDSEATH